jgi:hypothetical protein
MYSQRSETVERNGTMERLVQLVRVKSGKTYAKSER